MVKPSEPSKKTPSTPSTKTSNTTTPSKPQASSSPKPTSTTSKSTTTPSKSTPSTKSSTSTPKVTKPAKSNGNSNTSSTTTTTTTPTITIQETVNKKRTWAQVFEAPDFKTNFCGDCGNLLDISSLSKSNQVICKICGGTVARDELVAKTIITKSTLHTEKKNEDEEEIEENGATIEEACPVCAHIGLFFTTAQTRGADEGQTVFYKCRNCSHKFTQNN